MHALCRSFSQRRKSSKPRDLHIRKVSFSGCSLSGSDFSSSPSTACPPPFSARSTGPDPLAVPQSWPPTQLHHPEPIRRRETADTLFSFLEAGGSGAGEKTPHADMPLAPATCLLQRPSLPRSRWSDSTIATLDGGADVDDDDDDSLGGDFDPDAVPRPQPGHQSMPNFSYKRTTATLRRPPVRTLDGLDDFVKRGGWKRRGIVFLDDVNDAF